MPPARTHRLLFFALATALVWTRAVAQDSSMAHVIVTADDTLLSYSLPNDTVLANYSAKGRRAAEHLDRLTRNVQKVFPYALITAKLLDQYAFDLRSIKRDGDKELYMKLAEAELRAEFEDEVKEMTVTQGRILIKLIDRETGHTSYELVKTLRGSFQAWLWQGVARIFGNNLKDEYDPAGDDKLVESIVKRIENGDLACTPRAPKTEKAIARLEKRKARLYKKYGLQPAPVSAN